MQRQKPPAKVNILKTYILSSIQAELYISAHSSIQIAFNVFHLFIDIDRQLADNLSKVATIDINSLLTKMSDISKGVIYNIQQPLLKEWGLESLGVLPEDTLQELLTGVILIFLKLFFSLSNLPSYWFLPILLLCSF